MIYDKLQLFASKFTGRPFPLFKSISIKFRLMFFFLMISIIPISIIGTISYNKASGIINKQSKTYTETVLKQTVDRVESLLQEVSKIGYLVKLKPELRNNYMEDLDNIDYILSIKSLEAYFSSVLSNCSYISSIYACMADNQLVSSNRFGYYETENYSDFKVYAGNDSKKIVPFWTGLHENEFFYDALNGNKYVLSYTRPLFDQTSLRRYGAIIFNISKKEMDEICAPAFESRNSNLYIIDTKGGTIYNRDSSLFQKKVDKPYLQDILKDPEPQKSFINKINGSTIYVSYVYLKSSNWIYVFELPMDHLLQKSKDVRDITILIILICIPLAGLVSFLMATYMTNPIIKLIASMNRVEDGDFKGKLNISTSDEIGKLTLSYNKMLDKIELLLDSVKKENFLKRQAELKVLQAQITPHFLYNTLNSIKYMAYLDGNAKIHETSANLIELLQMSISNNMEFITVEEEINLVKNYLNLQYIRYDEKFRTVYEVSEEILKCKTLKLTIQPLVENSLLHGIDMEEGSGIIVIRAYKSKNRICFEVEDNGKGMSEEQLNEIIRHDSKSRKDKFSGIGVHNIDARIKMYFGNEYGISYVSRQGYGTSATVKVPLIIDESECSSYV